jgi:NADH:ubiquinone oxidoreductase subunit 4 (subunit M)
MITLFFFTNILTIFFVSVISEAVNYSSPNRHRFFKLVTLFLSIVMLGQFIYCTLAIDTFRQIENFSVNYDLLDFKLTFALEGFTVLFCFLTVYLIFICILLI